MLYLFGENCSYMRRACGRFSPHIHIHNTVVAAVITRELTNPINDTYILYVLIRPNSICNCLTLHSLYCYESTSLCSTTPWCIAACIFFLNALFLLAICSHVLSANPVLICHSDKCGPVVFLARAPQWSLLFISIGCRGRWWSQSVNVNTTERECRNLLFAPLN